MKSRRVGDICALTCAVACGLGNIPSKLALENISPELFNFYMFIFAGILSSLTLAKKENRVEISQVDAKTLGLIFLLSISFAVALTLNMSALKVMEPATVSFLSRFEVILTVVFAYMILKERLSFVEIIGGIIALAGVFILRFKTGMTIANGATLMVMSAFFFAASEVIVKKNITRLGTTRFLFYRNLIMIPMFLAILIFRGNPIYFPPTKVILWIFAAALLLPVVGRGTYQMALKRIDISRAALITQGTPIFTAIFALIILHSFPPAIEWLGGILIIAGVIVVKIAEGKLTAISLPTDNKQHQLIK